MKIAVAMDLDHTFYHKNPSTAPKFAIYTIKGEKSEVTYALSAIFENPWYSKKANIIQNEEINCECSIERQEDLDHACSHYAVLDVISGCSYLLADHYCNNTLKALKNGGVSIFKIPFMIRDIEIAIKNFLIGALYASTVQHIHHAS